MRDLYRRLRRIEVISEGLTGRAKRYLRKAAKQAIGRHERITAKEIGAQALETLVKGGA